MEKKFKVGDGQVLIELSEFQRLTNLDESIDRLKKGEINMLLTDPPFYFDVNKKLKYGYKLLSNDEVIGRYVRNDNQIQDIVKNHINYLERKNNDIFVENMKGYERYTKIQEVEEVKSILNEIHKQEMDKVIEENTRLKLIAESRLFKFLSKFF
jgi:hypothetical protein